MGNPDIDFMYKHIINGKEFETDTREIKKELEGISLTDPAVVQLLIERIREAINQLDKDTEN